MVFPVVMYGCGSWTVKKAECRRIDTFKLWCWRRLLQVPWTARRSNQSILKETSPGCSLEGLMLMLKLQYFGHLMQRADSFEKKSWGQEKGMTEDEMAGWHHQLDAHEFGWAPAGLKESNRTEWLNWTEYALEYTYHILFTHSCIHGQLGCFHLLTFLNNAARNLGVEIFKTCFQSFWVYVQK